MEPADLERYLHDRIPLSRAMGVRVLSAAPQGVVLEAPLAPNINHRDTVFGGSAAAVATLAAWSLVQVGLRAEGQAGRIVIRRSRMDFERPIAAAFRAVAAPPAAAEWGRLLSALRRGRMGRIEVEARLECAGEHAGALVGEFAVMPP